MVFAKGSIDSDEMFWSPVENHILAHVNRIGNKQGMATVANGPEKCVPLR